jgi:hypothetical protein
MKWSWDFNRDIPRPLSARLKQETYLISSTEDEQSAIDLPDPIRFKVQAVNGGTIIETRWWDGKKDETRVKLHIVTSDNDLAEAIGKIVTMELLQR